MSLYFALRDVVIPDLTKWTSFSYKTRSDGTREYHPRRAHVVEDGAPARTCVFGISQSPAWKWDVRASKMAQKYPAVDQLLRAHAARHFPWFEYTTITVNHNLKCKPHVDRGNAGTSIITSVGNFTGGELNIKHGSGVERFDTRDRFLMYDGARWEHWNEPIVGDKYSIVYFKDKSIVRHLKKNEPNPDFATNPLIVAARQMAIDTDVTLAAPTLIGLQPAHDFAQVLADREG